ncbi:uncharacterized protein APUU_70025S [Aspergillus puulaauensis]|uniref:VOC domain-containing protein n=1 Tax=Aspergillus puulaauensis TaxID=1220207 RepID=A0A7R7XVD8_9EURO|nr:uncharacterized protein APUU_70025S [Aspergillus puulaauensis]BCS28455.1 hypothetical protein APUU_70025S [Aspergillus puulaauensis]
MDHRPQSPTAALCTPSFVMAQRIPNRPLNHVAVSVPDIDAFVQWYTRVFGFQQMGTISLVKRSEWPDNPFFNIYPDNLNEYKIAYLATGNAASLEVMQFIDPAPIPPPEFFQYNRQGFFHICVTDPDPGSLANTAAEAGGRIIGEVIEIAGSDCAYVADPWGNIVEILSMSFERLVTSVST